MSHSQTTPIPWYIHIGLGIIVTISSLIAVRMRIFIVVGIGFLIWGLIQFFKQKNSAPKKTFAPHQYPGHHATQTQYSQKSHSMQQHPTSSNHHTVHQTTRQFTHAPQARQHTTQNQTPRNHTQVHARTAHSNDTAPTNNTHAKQHYTAQHNSHSQQQHHTAHNGLYKGCPNCKATIPRNARFCPYCGYGV